MADKIKLNWTQYGQSDIDAFPKPLKEAWNKYKAAMEPMLTARKAFEATFSAMADKAGSIPAGQECAFGYGYGKLAVALTDKPEGRAGGEGKLKLKLA